MSIRMENPKFDSRKTIFIFAGTFLPGVSSGGPLTSLVNLIHTLHEKNQFVVLANNTDFNSDIEYSGLKPNVIYNREGYQIIYFRKSILNLFSYIYWLRINIKKEDVLYLNSFFNFKYSILVVFLNYFKIIKPSSIILATRGELFDSSLKFKSLKKSLYIRLAGTIKLYRNVTFQCSNELEKGYLRGLSLRPSVIYVIENIPTKFNLVNTGVYDPHDDEVSIIFVGRITREKNLLFALRTINKLSFKLRFDIFGIVEDENYWRECCDLIARLGHEHDINYRGIIPRNEVHDVLNQYDLLFLPTFGENYGHVIVESLSVGTPVLISDNTPWRSLVTMNLGWDINLENEEDFIHVLEDFSKISAKERLCSRQKRRSEFNKIFDNETLTNNYIKLFNGNLQ